MSSFSSFIIVYLLSHFLLDKDHKTWNKFCLVGIENYMNILIFVQFETEQRQFRKLINKTKSCVTTTVGSFKIEDWLSFTVCDFNHLAPYLKLCKMRSLRLFSHHTKSYPLVQYEQQRHRTGTSRSHISNILPERNSQESSQEGLVT